MSPSKNSWILVKYAHLNLQSIPNQYRGKNFHGSTYYWKNNNIIFMVIWTKCWKNKDEIVNNYSLITIKRINGILCPPTQYLCSVQYYSGCILWFCANIYRLLLKYFCPDWTNEPYPEHVGRINTIFEKFQRF